MNENKSIILNGIWRNSTPYSGKIILTGNENVSVIEFLDYQKDDSVFEGKIFYKDNKIYSGNIDKVLFVPHGEGKVVF